MPFQLPSSVTKGFNIFGAVTQARSCADTSSHTVGASPNISLAHSSLFTQQNLAEVHRELGLDLSAGNAEMIQMERLQPHSLDKETNALNQGDKGLIRDAGDESVRRRPEKASQLKQSECPRTLGGRRRSRQRAQPMQRQRSWAECEEHKEPPTSPCG